jgi:hypothetical protein
VGAATPESLVEVALEDPELDAGMLLDTELGAALVCVAELRLVPRLAPELDLALETEFDVADEARAASVACALWSRPPSPAGLLRPPLLEQRARTSAAKAKAAVMTTLVDRTKCMGGSSRAILPQPRKNPRRTPKPVPAHVAMPVPVPVPEPVPAPARVPTPVASPPRKRLAPVDTMEVEKWARGCYACGPEEPESAHDT